MAFNAFYQVKVKSKVRKDMRTGEPEVMNLTFIDQLLAQDTYWELKRDGYEVSWEPHGYTIMRNAEQVADTIKSWDW
jgi:hypothetical protein